MDRKLIPLLVAVPLLFIIVAYLIFGRSGPMANSEDAGTDSSASAPSAEQSYAQDMGATLDQLNAWRTGPITQRTEILAQKMENAGALSNLTYGQILLLYRKAQASGRSDLGMDWIIQGTIAPTLQPIYESIVTDGTALASALGAAPPPDSLAENHNRIAGCVNYEVERSQTVVDILSGTSTATLPEQSSDPCAQLDVDVEAIETFIETNAAQ